MKIIAIVGTSDKIGKPSHLVAAYLKKHGYTVTPLSIGSQRKKLNFHNRNS